MRLRQGCTLVAAMVAVLGLGLAGVAAADSDPYAPLDRAGPALSARGYLVLNAQTVRSGGRKSPMLS